MVGPLLFDTMMGNESKTIGRRRDSRLRLEIPAKVIALGGQYRASLCDLSQSGARLRTSQPLKMGENAVLTWLEYESFGRVVWSANGFAGMEFDELIGEQVLLRTRKMMDSGVIRSEEQIHYEEAKAWFTGRC